jgi:phospholipase C
MHLPMRRASAIGVAAALALGGAAAAAATASAASAAPAHTAWFRGGDTTTPIKHLVVIFQENVSFDHYFGTYPNAANTSGQTFSAERRTPAVNGLTPALLTANPNGANPRRYDPTNINDVLTCDQDHNYADEQTAFDGGKMDKFISSVGNGGGTSPEGGKCVASDVMNYYDGNTTTALWNYAQQFAMSDNSYGTTFGPSAPGAINLVSGDTGGVDMAHTANSPSVATASSPNADLTANGLGGFSLTSDAQPYYDDCSTRDAVALTGTNIGDELNTAGVSWGWFQGGFRPTTSFAAAATAVGQSGQSTATFTPDEFSAFGAVATNRPAHSSNQGICNAVTPVGAGLTSYPGLTVGTGQYGYKDDYIPHHEPFQYYASTANPHHLTIPTNASGQDTLSGLATIGRDTQSYANGAPQFNTPNHNYDTSDFNQLVAAIAAHKLPASALPGVSFLKAPGYEDGHAGYSDPLDEQQFVVNTINALEKTPDWNSTAVVINYDDSDGWYDHAFSGVTNPSTSVADTLTGTGACGSGTPLAGEQGRCGYGPRLPMIVISPWAKHNYVDHTLTSQTSIIKFVENNWELPRIPGSFDSVTHSIASMFDFDHHGDDHAPNDRPFILDPVTGQLAFRDPYNTK